MNTTNAVALSPLVGTLPFGRYAGQPLSGVPGDYLRWLVGQKLSTGLRLVVTAELQRRGEPVPAPKPAPVPSCGRCGPAGKLTYTWSCDSLGRRVIRRTCRQCQRFLDFAPLVVPYTELADAAGKVN